jgi:LAO/AO transport system kinase
LKREFFNRPAVASIRNSVEQQVISGALSPFSGALELLDAFKAH